MVKSVKEPLPIAVLSTPVTEASKAFTPIAVLVLTEFAPLPTVTPLIVESEPTVIATPTLTFCRNVAFVFVLIFSVDATPVNSAPLPTKLVAVTIPVANISPSLLKVIPLPTTIPFLAVISPTASTFVTSS